jgi:cobalamin biosynthesis protein CobT
MDYTAVRVEAEEGEAEHGEEEAEEEEGEGEEEAEEDEEREQEEEDEEEEEDDEEEEEEEEEKEQEKDEAKEEDDIQRRSSACSQYSPYLGDDAGGAVHRRGCEHASLQRVRHHAVHRFLVRFDGFECALGGHVPEVQPAIGTSG